MMIKQDKQLSLHAATTGRAEHLETQQIQTHAGATDGQPDTSRELTTSGKPGVGEAVSLAIRYENAAVAKRIDNSSLKQVSEYVGCVFEPDDLIEVRMFTWNTDASKLDAIRSEWSAAKHTPDILARQCSDTVDGYVPTIGVLTRKARGLRGDNNTLLGRILCVDLERINTNDAIQRVADAGLPDPTMTICSGHGLHAYWRLKQTLLPHEWSQLQVRLAARLDGDATITNPERLMRLPGFLNPKPPAKECSIISCVPERRYDLQDIVVNLSDSVSSAKNNVIAPSSETTGRIGEGNRNNSLASMGGLLRNMGVSPEIMRAALLGLNQTACHPPLTNEEVTAVASSIARYSSQASSQRGKTPSPLESHSLSMGEMRKLHNAQKQPLIFRLLRRGELMNVIGSPKAGKSWLVHDLALHLASGRRWLGNFDTESSRVLIVDNELHRSTLTNRLCEIASARKIGFETVDNRVTVEPLRGRLVDLHALDRYFAAIGRGVYDVIILDAFYRFLPDGVDENSNAGMGALYNVLDRIAANLDAAIILVHHTTKGNQSGKSLTDVGAGAGAQSRAADTHLVLRSHEESSVFVLDAVARSWPPLEPFCIEKQIPVFQPKPDLDPTRLEGGRGASKRSSPSAESMTEELIHFVHTCVNEKRQSRTQICLTAIEKLGWSNRKAERLLCRAISSGQVEEVKEGRNKFYHMAGQHTSESESLST